MRYTFDTEFIDDGERIELLSIGIVAEDGREYYAVVDDLALMQKAWWTNDIKQEHRRLGYPRIPEQAEGSHNALEDARWNWSTLRYLEALDGPVLSVPEGPVSVANPKRTRVW